MNQQAFTNSMTSGQIAWASRHDWFVAANQDGTITVTDARREADGSFAAKQIAFLGSFAELRSWAGY